MSPTEELQMLVAEQEKDQRFGHRVHSLLIDDNREPDMDGSRVEFAIERCEGVYLYPRPAHRRDRCRGILGYRIRRKAWARCLDCFTPVSYGKSGYCRSCALKRRRRAAGDGLPPHGGLRRYRSGCDCDECVTAWKDSMDRYKPIKNARRNAKRRAEREAGLPRTR